MSSFFQEFEETRNTLYPLMDRISLDPKDSIINSRIYKSMPRSNNWLIRKLRYEHFFTVRENNFELNISPLLILELNKDIDKDERIFRNTRGIYLEATIGKNIGFNSSFHENQSGLMDHVAMFSDYFGVVPGQGFHKPFKKVYYDYAWSEGILCYKPLKSLSIEFGHGKRFIGNGYRSMLYSDNSFSYPHLFFDFKKNKIQYIWWYTSFMNPDLPEPIIILNHPWQRKAGVFHYITYQPFSGFSLGIFEGSIMYSRDRLGNYNFDLRQYNPVIAVNSFNKKSNNYAGLNINYQIRDYNFFGQYLFNPQQNNKNGWQLGAGYRHHFPYSFISIQAELNHASKGMYTFTDSVIGYTHYNQPLAHPLGENFTECVIKSSIRIRSSELEYKFNYAISKSDSTGFLPALNLFYPENMTISLPDQSVRQIHEIKLSYIINPQYNMRLTFGIFFRNYNFTERSNEKNYYYISFQTPLFNRYYDF